MTDTFTPDELGRLRVPLSALPGLCATGLHLWRGERHVTCVYDEVTPTFDPEDHVVVLVVQGDEDTRVEQSPRDEWAIDLTEEPARDRVARRLGKRYGAGSPPAWATAPTWEMSGTRWREYHLTSGAVRHTFERDFPPFVDVGLDSDDVRRLPDGCLFHVVLALALVAVAEVARG